MPEQLDVKGYCAIKFGAAFSYIPMLPGSQITDAPNLQKVLLASNASFEAINWIQGLCQPVLLIQTLAFSTWFTPTNLTAMLNSRDTTTGGSGTGLMPSLGPIDFRYGSGAGGDITGKFTKSYVGAMSISAGGIGTPIGVTMVVLPAGSDADVTALGTPTLNYGMPYLSQGVGFSDSGSDVLSDVQGYSLSFDNLMSPDTSLPITAGANAKVYPNAYHNGPLGFGVSVVQKLGAASVLESTNLSNTFNHYFKMRDPAGANRVLFAFRTFNPERGATQRMGLGMVQRSYQNIRTSADAAAASSLSITA